MIKRNSKEIAYKKNSSFDIKYGTFNRKNPGSIYIFGRTWIKPPDEYISSLIPGVCKKLKRYRPGSPQFKKKILVNVNITQEKIRAGQKSCFTFEIHLLQNEVTDISSPVFEREISSVISGFTDIIEEKFHHCIQRVTRVQPIPSCSSD